MGQCCVVVFDYLYMVVDFICVVNIDFQVIDVVKIEDGDFEVFQFFGGGVGVGNCFFDLFFYGVQCVNKMGCC